MSNEIIKICQSFLTIFPSVSFFDVNIELIVGPSYRVRVCRLLQESSKYREQKKTQNNSHPKVLFSRTLIQEESMFYPTLYRSTQKSLKAVWAILLCTISNKAVYIIGHLLYDSQHALNI